MTKRIFPLILVLFMLCAGFALAEEMKWPTLAERAQMNTKIERVTDEPITLTMWMGISAHDVTNVVGDIQNLDILKTLEEKTGVRIELICPPIGEDASHFSLMLASGQYADIIIHFEGNYAKRSETAVEEGIILDLKELIEQYAPNYQAVRTASQYRAINTITDSGSMPYFCSVSYMDMEGTTGGGAIIRKDLLEKLNMDMPVTFDDWHEYLTRCKDELGMTRGFGLAYTGISKYNVLNAAYEFGTNDVAQGGLFFVKDGVVTYGPLTEGYRDYLERMAQWYAEGLIDPDFTSTITFDDGIALMSSDLCSATSEHGGVLGYINSLGQAINPDFEFVPIASPVLYEGQQLHYGYMKSGAPIGKNAAISSTCKDPVIAVKFIDQLYTDEGFMLCNYGTLGKSYELVDGVPVFTDLIMDNELGTSTHMMCAYAASIAWPFEMVIGRESPPDLTGYGEVWDSNNDYSYSFPSGVTLTPEEIAVYSDFYPDIQTYVEEMNVQIIMGLVPVEDYDSFAQKLRELGIEEVLSAYQSAYDRYINR